HSTLIDYLTERRWVPLAEIPSATGRFWVYDSLLSEYAALGFEYGYAHSNQQALVMWEAQFGDFVNGAQIIIDQYLVAAEDKWQQKNGLVLLLPHGYEGQGPEHSSARIERFLQLCAEDNIQVCYPTTSAQYFHLLRRQVKRNNPKPLVIFSPKQPLRMKQSRSPLAEFTKGSFEEVLDDSSVAKPDEVMRVVLCSGKVAWDAIAERRSVRKLYVETLVKRGDITVEQAEKSLSDYQSKLQGALEQTRAKTGEKVIAAKPPKPVGVVPHIQTGVNKDVLDKVLASLRSYPSDFMVHPKLLRQFEARDAMIDKDGDIDWAVSEAVAIGSLVIEGTSVRL
ncbi:MAG: hypothetical protein ACKOFM_04065, partial [Actinomycetota bacterium]